MTYLEPRWQPADAKATRKLDHSCIWIVGRCTEQVEDFETLLRSTLPRKTTLITSVVQAAYEPQPSLAIWNLAGDTPDVIVVLPGSEGEYADGQSETAILFGLAKSLMEHAFSQEIDLFFLVREDFGISPALDALPALAHEKAINCKHHWKLCTTGGLATGETRNAAANSEAELADMGTH